MDKNQVLPTWIQGLAVTIANSATKKPKKSLKFMMMMMLLSERLKFN